jgi:excisionase family DNA binding protein
MGTSDLVGAAEAAEILGVDRATVLRWLAKPRLTAEKLSGARTSAWLIDRAEVERLRDELAQAAS